MYLKCVSRPCGSQVYTLFIEYPALHIRLKDDDVIPKYWKCLIDFRERCDKLRLEDTHTSGHVVRRPPYV